MVKTKKTAGLADIIVGESSICTVGQEGKGLSYRGYSIDELAAHANFEEVAYLLLYGQLPTQAELDLYRKRLISKRNLPDALKRILEILPADSHPMDVMRTACSVLGSLEQEHDFSQQQDIADRLLAVFPSILTYWRRYHQDGTRIDTNTDDTSIAAHFLHLLTGKPASENHIKALDVSLILYAEHEFNASTFAARVTASTLSDFYSAIVSAIGTLRGPLHGGANEAAMELISKFSSAGNAEKGIYSMLENKKLIMGFGHRVYRISDPRSPIIKSWSKKLADEVNDNRYFAVSEKIESIMWQEKKLFPNLDFYSASTYYFMGIPVPLYTPIFICSRITGWAAHVFEQRQHNALIRPSSMYTGPGARAYVPIMKRKVQRQIQ